MNAVVAAVKSGRLSARRIDQSVARILAAKARVGLDRSRLVDLEAIGDVIDAPDGIALAQSHADAAMTLVKNDGDLLPLKQPGAACYLVLAENRFGMQGRRFLDELRRRQPKASATLLDPALPETEFDAAAARLSQCETAVVAAFAGFPKLVESLIATGKPVALVAFGSPYVLRQFPRATAYLAAFSTTPTSEAAAIKALFGEIPIRGKLPVTIPASPPSATGFSSGALSGRSPLISTSDSPDSASATPLEGLLEMTAGGGSTCYRRSPK